MTVRIAAFNVENLFDRPKAFNDQLAQSSAVLDAHADLNKLFEKPNYNNANKSEMLTLMDDLAADGEALETAHLLKMKGGFLQCSCALARRGRAQK